MQQPKKKQREVKLCGSHKKENEKTSEGDDEIRRLVEERRNTAKGDEHKLKELSKRIKKMHQGKKKNKTSRKDKTDSRRIQERSSRK